ERKTGSCRTRRSRTKRVRAGIYRVDRIERQQSTIATGVASDAIVLLAAICTRPQMLAAVFQPTHRHSKADGDPGQRDLFAAEQTLVAETAADIGRNHANRAVAEAQAFGHAALHDMRHLRRRDQREKT